jgi:hypothetical protein
MIAALGESLKRSAQSRRSICRRSSASLSPSGQIVDYGHSEVRPFDEIENPCERYGHEI